jgi:polyisoprenoid-binding protein YceI
MKKTFLVFATASLFLASCQDAPTADSATVTEAQDITNQAGENDYKTDVAQSKVEFVGTKPVGSHHGTIMIQDGNLSIENNQIKGGSFVIDVNSLKADDQDSAGNANLTGHLLSPDFFDAANHPTAKFEISSVTEGIDPALNNDLKMSDATHTVTGNLELKGVTKSVTFPAKVNINGNTVTTDANFNIDRTQWGLSYGNDKSLKDKFINPIVNISLHIVNAK